MRTNNISYDIFNSRHVSKVAAHFSEEKQDVHMVIQVSEQRKWKSIKTTLPYLEPCQISMMERFYENIMAKSC